MDKLEGWRTLVTAAVAFAYAALEKLSMLPEAFTVSDASNAIMVLAGIFFGLRHVTKKPVGYRQRI